MKTVLAFALLLCTHVLAQQIPWADPSACARHVGLNERGVLAVNYAYYRSYSSGLAETIGIYRRLHGDPELRLSVEQLQYALGFYRVMRAADYAADCDSFSELDAQTQHLLKVQEQRKLTSDDFRGGPWIHMLTAVGQDELACLNYIERAGVVTGCGDVWQGGLTAEEVVCHDGKNYLKCHVECVTRLNQSSPTLQPGFCP